MAVRGILSVAATAILLFSASSHAEDRYESRPAWQRAGYTAASVVVNTVPVTSALVAPQCLPGYFLCKLSFAGMSLVAAGEQLFLAGGADPAQFDAILSRGFGGDWIVTGRHVAGDAEAVVLPAPPPPAPSGGGGFEPPPL